MLCFLPLLTGACIYIFFRQEGLLGFTAVSGKKNLSKSAEVLIGTIPDFCWCLSLANALYLFAAFREIEFWKTTWLAGTVIILSEIVQLFFPPAFTFDIFDLLAAIFAFALSFFYFKCNRI